MSSTMQSRHRCSEYFSSRRISKNRRDDDKWFEERHVAEECVSSGKNFNVPFSSTLRKALDGFPFIAMDQDVICGTPRITGTRIPVYMVLDAVQYYGTIEGVLKSYPQLTAEQVKEAVSFASAVLEQPVEYEFEAVAG